MLVIGEFFSKGLIFYLLLLIFSSISLFGYKARKRQDTFEKLTEGKADPFEHLKGSVANKSLSSFVNDNQNKPASENKFFNIDKL